MPGWWFAPRAGQFQHCYIGAQCGVLLAGNAVPIGLTLVQNTGDRIAVNSRQEKLTTSVLKAALGRAYI